MTFLINGTLSSRLISTTSADDLLNWESENSSGNTITPFSQRANHTYTLRSRPIQAPSSCRTKTTSSLISALLRQHAQPRLSDSENIFRHSLIIHFHSDLPLILKLRLLFTHTQDLLFFLETNNQFIL